MQQKDLSELKISDLMSSTVVTVKPSDPIEDALINMATKGISCVIAVEDNKPIGIITERDVTAITAVSPDNAIPMDLGVDDVMSSPVITVHQDEVVDNLVLMVAEARFRHIPVVDDDGGLVGLITQSDIIRALARTVYNTAHPK